jgi:hypothetical protein
MGFQTRFKTQCGFVIAVDGERCIDRCERLCPFLLIQQGVGRVHRFAVTAKSSALIR